MDAMKGMQGPALMVAMLGCCITPFIISTTFMGLYWGLFADAAKFNDEYKDAAGNDNPFDRCTVMPDEAVKLAGYEPGDTKWTVVYTLNAVVYTMLSASTLCLFLSALLWPLAFCGICGFICSQMAHFAALIVTGVFRYSDDGEKCAESETNYDAIDKSMSDIGSTMEGLFISQCVLYCFYGCCMGCFAQVAMMTAMMRRMGM